MLLLTLKVCKWLVLLTMILLLFASLVVPPPANVTIQAYNLNTVIFWDYPIMLQNLCLPYQWWTMSECHFYLFILFCQSLCTSHNWFFHHPSFPCDRRSCLNYTWHPDVIGMQVNSFQNISCLLVHLVSDLGWRSITDFWHVKAQRIKLTVLC